MKLNEIKDNKGARKGLMRVGRGVGSGKGRTAGRGIKGQKSRTGVSINGFEGGQTSFIRRLPKRGFDNTRFQFNFTEINLGRLQQAIDTGSVNPKEEINAVSLMEAGVIKNARDGIRLLAKGTLTSAITIRVVGASAAAVAAVEKAKGKVIVEPKAKTVLEKGVKTSKKESKKK